MMQLYTDEDHLLWQKIKEGSSESFNALYSKYWQILYCSALKRLKNHHQAQDITQEVFVNLWLKRMDLQIDNLSAYLQVAVRNKVLNLFEKEKRYISISRLLEDNFSQYGDPADVVALRNEFLQAYRDLVDALPEQRKKIFQLHYDENLSTEDIARRLQLSRKTIQNQLGRAVSFLKTNLSNLFILYIIFCN